MTKGHRSDTPTRSIHPVVELEARIEEQLWRWDAEMGDAGVKENDKLRTLLFYAWQECRTGAEALDREATL